MPQRPATTLSFCIATYNRANFLAHTLDSILSQITGDCEIVVSDNASTDATPEVLAEYAKRDERLRYVRQERNVGIDRNFNHAVEHAQGKYCWLMPDDDVVKEEAVQRVLDALRSDFSLVLINYEFRDHSLKSVMQQRLVNVQSDKVYKGCEIHQLLVELPAELIVYAGSYVFERAVWLERDRSRYFGSLFAHVGTIFESPMPKGILLIASPLVSYRVGNVHSYGSAGHAWLAKWPSFVESLPIGEATRNRINKARPWESPQWLLLLRGLGMYTLTDYRRWLGPRVASFKERLILVLIALCPPTILSLVLLPYYASRPDQTRFVHLLRQRRQRVWGWHRLD